MEAIPREVIGFFFSSKTILSDDRQSAAVQQANNSVENSITVEAEMSESFKETDPDFVGLIYNFIT